MQIVLENTYWEEVKGFISEFKIDKRWILRKESDPRSYGKLRVVSFPNLSPGQLHYIFTIIKSIEQKTKPEIIKSIEDYQMDVIELEVYSVDENIETETIEDKLPVKKIEELFGVRIF